LKGCFVDWGWVGVRGGVGWRVWKGQQVVAFPSPLNHPNPPTPSTHPSPIHARRYGAYVFANSSKWPSAKAVESDINIGNSVWKVGHRVTKRGDWMDG